MTQQEKIDLLEEVRTRLWRDLDPSFEGQIKQDCLQIDRTIAEMKMEPAKTN